MKRIFYSKEELEYMKLMYLKYSAEVTTKKLNKKFGNNRSEEAVKKRCTKFKLKKHKPKVDGRIAKRYSDHTLFLKIYLNGRWRHYSRYVWEKANGELTSNQIVMFKDGDKFNCNLENLYVISRRRSMLLNSHLKFTPDQAECKEVILDIKDQITKMEKA